MSNCLIPPEIWDHIADFLQDNPDTLKQCCLVSKPWVPRARKHLFAILTFGSPVDLEAWKQTFPDPSNSPAHHTRTLSICSMAVTAVDVAGGDWVAAFSRVVSLDVVVNNGSDLGKYLVPFHSNLKSLHVRFLSFSHSQVVDLIRCLPLLEDLTLQGYDRGDDESRTVSSSSTSPPLTGTLSLLRLWGFARVVYRLLDLPNGLRFRNLKLASNYLDDLLSVGKLVEACSGTLEYLDVRHKPQGRPIGGPIPCPINLSKATKLKEVVFGCGFTDINWVTAALETAAECRDLKGISIHVPPVSASGVIPAIGNRVVMLGDQTRTLGSDLVRLLVQLWESCLIRTKILYPSPVSDDERRGAADWPGYLLPQSAGRGIVDLVQEQ